MKLLSLHVAGFGRLHDRAFAFGPGLNVVVGQNEAGKSTLAAALVASLYGLQRGEKDRWRPWSGAAFGTTLRYETADGAVWEVRREFERDTKGIRVYDADGNDAGARVGKGKSLVPGEAHLRISHDVFTQTACARQRAVAFDVDAAEDVSGALARALGGGPKEDAAIGALSRLDDALRKHVGTQRAHKNAPLKALREREERERRAAADARAALAELGSLRERIVALRAERDHDLAATAELERRTRALRAAHLRARLGALKEYRAELAALQSDRAAYDDVADFPAERVGALTEAYHLWRSAEGVAEAAADEAAGEALGAAEAHELAARARDAGTLDDDALAALRAAAAQAEAAHARAAAASHAAAAARREGDGGRALAGALVVAAIVAFLADVGVAIAHLWIETALLSVVAIVLAVAAFARARSRAARRADADAKQRVADDAIADERNAADAVARVLEPLGIPTLDELVARHERYTVLRAREADTQKARARAQTARSGADEAAARFDTLADALVPDVHGSREERRAAAAARAARRGERDGIDARLAMLAMRRGDILHGEDDFALQTEYDALLADGVEPASDDDGSLHALERERAELDGRARDAERTVASLEGELRRGEEAVPDLAALDEALATTRAAIARLEAFARAIALAKETIETRKDEAHRAFARRLEQYSAGVLGTITAGRYAEIRLDPATLALKVRVPETGAIEEIEKLSAGTRDQIALVVRFATARMFAEGLETPPLLLDDPFAFWDTARTARCMPVLTRGAQGAQTILFTASEELAGAAAEAGATRIELTAPLVTT
ncbi:MAG TPA: AAA family ATPase [Candidatus Limnocylindria bacterium]|nr:AAA family ATPase [Candidatus Limnocylindria bacterium]